MARASSVIPNIQSLYPAGGYLSSLQSLDPRPLEELHNERSYLLYNLQKQNDRATRLFERYASIEARLTEAATPSEAKKCRKEAALIRSKIAESTQQEQLMLLRLSEIQIELQNRDRWMRVHSQPSSYFQPQHPPFVYPPPAPPAPPPSANMSFSSDVLPHPQSNMCEAPAQFQSHNDKNTPTTATTTTHPTCPCPSSSSVLSPLSPCFTPGVCFIEDIWSRASKTPSADKEEAKSWSELAEEEDEEEEEGSRGTGSGFTDEEAIGANENRDGGGVDSAAGDGGDAGGDGNGGELPYQHQNHYQQQRQQKGDRPEEKRHGALPTKPTTNPTYDADSEGRDERDNNNKTGLNKGGEYEEEDMHAWRTRLRRISLFLPVSVRSAGEGEGREEKRMSLPHLKGLWHNGSRRGSAQSTMCYYYTVTFDCQHMTNVKSYCNLRGQRGHRMEFRGSRFQRGPCGDPMCTTPSPGR
ncbi:hypothetical protein VTJ49DRAFT_1960 [Mycothermus thermophilus]|uniref:Uncharacterized protein n=1 Tax=Humicola insolens TaxID=85995 RepID=A0ABR3VNY6_HUMIN